MKTGPKPISRDEAWETLKRETFKTPGGCWLMTWGRPIGIGYRSIRAGSRALYAHRFAYEMVNGQINNDVIRHTCDQPNCVNPAHLICCSHADNVADKVAKGRHPKGAASVAAVLTEQQVLDIYQASGFTYQQLSEKYGISRGGIHNIKSGRTWSHLTGARRDCMESGNG